MSRYSIVGQKMLKSPAKKTREIKYIHFTNLFRPNSNFVNGQKSIFELGKSLKLPKMQFHDFDFIWFH